MALPPTDRSVSHVLFDMDGLLLDTETLYTVAQQHVCQEYGREFTWSLKAKMMGKKAIEAAQLLVDELGLAGQLSPEEFLKQVRGSVHVCA
jgi:beta-phosphoglucomutase-like phosphatase (HAD superfamily)